MNKLTRAVTLGGFGVLTALTVGMGPAAQAAPVAPVSPESKTTVSHNIWRGESQIVGFYRSLRACQLAGVYGERAGAWDDYDCTIVRVGARRGAWALEVADYDNWGPSGYGRPFQVVRGFPTQFRPVWVGQFRPVRPGQFRHFRPGSHRNDWIRDRDRRHHRWGHGNHGGWGNGNGNGNHHGGGWGNGNGNHHGGGWGNGNGNNNGGGNHHGGGHGNGNNNGGGNHHGGGNGHYGK